MALERPCHPSGTSIILYRVGNRSDDTRAPYLCGCYLLRSRHLYHRLSRTRSLLRFETPLNTKCSGVDEISAVRDEFRPSHVENLIMR